MLIAMQKKLLWIVVIWFAILQTVTPFIHAHLEADSPAQGHGLHLHDESLLQMAENGHTLSVHPTHAVGVNAAVVEDVDPLPMPLLTLLFVISLSVIVVGRVVVSSIKSPLQQLYLHSNSSPRSPPLF
jgi:hypothetical protein